MAEREPKKHSPYRRERRTKRKIPAEEGWVLWGSVAYGSPILLKDARLVKLQSLTERGKRIGASSTTSLKA